MNILVTTLFFLFGFTFFVNTANIPEFDEKGLISILNSDALNFFQEYSKSSPLIARRVMNNLTKDVLSGDLQTFSKLDKEFLKAYCRAAVMEIDADKNKEN